MKKILVPIDFSDDSLNALDHAINTANAANANVRMIHVITKASFHHSLTRPQHEQLLRKNARENFEIILEDYTSGYKVKGGKVDYVIREGSIFTEISNQSKYDDMGLIVMGTHGASGFLEFFAGSNAYRVVSHAPCPVLTIREQFKWKKPERIVLPIDAASLGRKKVPFAVQFAKIFNAQLIVYGVYQSHDKFVKDRIKGYMAQVVKFIEDSGLTCVKKLEETRDITNATINFAENEKADLIIISTEQTEDTKNLFFGSYAESMVNHSNIPVISIPLE